MTFLENLNPSFQTVKVNPQSEPSMLSPKQIESILSQPFEIQRDRSEKSIILSTDNEPQLSSALRMLFPEYNIVTSRFLKESTALVFSQPDGFNKPSRLTLCEDRPQSISRKMFVEAFAPIPPAGCLTQLCVWDGQNSTTHSMPHLSNWQKIVRGLRECGGIFRRFTKSILPIQKSASNTTPESFR